MIIRESRRDTIMRFFQKDTVLIREGRLAIKYVTRKDSTIYIQGKCAADTIIKYYPEYINNVKVLEQNISWWDRVKLFLIDNLAWFILLIAAALWLVKRFKIFSFLN